MTNANAKKTETKIHQKRKSYTEVNNYKKNEISIGEYKSFHKKTILTSRRYCPVAMRLTIYCDIVISNSVGVLN